MMSENRETAPADGRWYLLRTKSRQEARAEDNLRRQAYHCYCPRMAVQKIRNGRRVAGEEVMFPGYLFIFLAEHENWSPIRSTYGVLKMVAFNGQPLAVPTSIIEELQQHEAGKTPAREPLTRGDKLSIVRGPFVNLQAVFERFDGEERVVVLLDILQQQQRLKLPLADIQSA